MLGVDCSATEKRWQPRPLDERVAMALAQRLDLPEVVARVMAARGVGLNEAEGFLDPRLKDLMPDPSRLGDMDKAAERFAAAIRAGEATCIFGDYDVDGATSSALLTRFALAAGGKAPSLYVPDRLTEGYGPNGPAMEKIAGQGSKLVITVDCGTLAFDALKTAKAAGLDVIVVDHHTAEPDLPEAVAVVNPNRLDDEPGLGHLAAVGVAFLLVVATNRVLRTAGWYGDERPEPRIMDLLDLVALGTVCDVVPLTGLNRAYVTQGLKVMAARGNVGLRALADVAGVDEAPTAYHLGFVLGPRINAGGRVGESHLGATLLSSSDAEAALSLSMRLDQYNADRQTIEADVLQAATDQAFEQVKQGDSARGVVLVAGEGWHPGVVGIVASRLKERFQVPACVIGIGEDGRGLGSARSITGIDLGAGVIAARQAGLLIKGGGHAMAAGFTVARDRIDDLRSFLNERFADLIATRNIRPTIKVDGALTVGACDMALVEALDRLGPYGAGNAEPRFVIPQARIVKAAPVGAEGRHVKATLTDLSGKRLEAIAFRAADSGLANALLNTGGRPLHLVGRLRPNSWMGRVSVQFQIEDAAAL